MSPDTTWRVPVLSCFPRVSGDEPVSFIGTHMTVEFSPRERG